MNITPLHAYSGTLSAVIRNINIVAIQISLVDMTLVS
jgi:hypothetical protein